MLDSNILIDFLSGIPGAEAAIAKYDDAVISVISWIEVLAGAENDEASKQLKLFLGRWPVVDIDSNIAESSARLRRTTRLRLADALILATARIDHRMVVTRNTKDFKPDWPDIVVPYVLTPH